MMFEDGRSKRVVFIAHCFLNQNSISDGTAVYPAAFKEMSEILLNADIGIVQMPCPEICCLGLDRGNIHGADSLVVVENTRIRSAMQNDDSNLKLTRLADYVVQHIMEYKNMDLKLSVLLGQIVLQIVVSKQLRTMMQKSMVWDCL